MKYPYLKFYFRDWQASTEIQSCSPAAKGIWIELMCIMAQSERYGYLEANGKPIQPATVARLLRCDKDELKPLLAELEANSVFSRASDTGAIYSRRMVRDNAAAQSFAEYGRRGGNPALKQPQKNDPPAPPRIQDSITPIPIPTLGLSGEVKEGDIPQSTTKKPKEAKPIRVSENTDIMKRIGSWFGRKPTTLWYTEEADKLRRLAPQPNEIDEMEAYYTATINPQDDFRRRDLPTLLNTWQGELDRAARNKQTASSGFTLRHPARPASFYVDKGSQHDPGF